MKVSFRGDEKKIKEQTEMIEKNQIIMKATIKVLPFYLTWLVLSMISLQEDVRASNL
jgi:hypothetical protein